MSERAVTVWDFDNTYDGGWAYYLTGGSSKHIERSIGFRSGYLAAERAAQSTANTSPAREAGQ